MHPVFILVSVVGILLLVLLGWRFHRERLWAAYPFFFTYFAYTCAYTAAVTVLQKVEVSALVYNSVYWFGETASVILSFCVAWEVFRQAFRALPAVRRIAGSGVSLILFSYAVGLWVRGRGPGNSFYNLEREGNLGVALFLLLTLALVRYYGIPLGRNVWGMAIGLALQVCTNIVNFAAFELSESFLPYYRFIHPVSFDVTFTVWTWALWSYVPSPVHMPSVAFSAERTQGRWAEVWKQMRATIRRAAGR